MFWIYNSIDSNYKHLNVAWQKTFENFGPPKKAAGSNSAWLLDTHNSFYNSPPMTSPSAVSGPK